MGTNRPYRIHGKELARGTIGAVLIHDLGANGPATAVQLAERLDLQPWGSEVAAKVLSMLHRKGRVSRTGDRGRGPVLGGYVYAVARSDDDRSTRPAMRGEAP